MQRRKGNNSQIRVGITSGDLNGIGMEIVLKALSDPRLFSICTPVLYGNPKATTFHKKALKGVDVHFNITKSADQINPRKPNLVAINNDEIKITLGKPSVDTGAFAFQSLEAATKDLAEGHIDVLVTAPINKKSIQDAGFKFPGHTEYLMDYSHTKDALMFMVSDNLKIGVVSGHVALKDVVSDISKDKIVHKLELIQKSLQSDFGIHRPKIAVLGLNPHAGDEGVMGTEEADIIKPAIAGANEKGILAFGPYGADGFFGSGQHHAFDAVLAMYHDQGLTPFKAITFDSGVNFTAGLPIVRTSPAHGTAYDIAGKNEAEAQSMLSAIYMAIDIFNTRKQMKEWGANPLQKQRISRGNEDK
ncbi:4-hydroxythreonine-4-phosphate dehydrogenase PdxA [Luteibaculum oceani]|uniref:4-hydroxythreonine-4-phosphate dehydrogenase PdxA n=1 Tax=Luteibaculum oceani TaxID=1294296 RepID=A0A5C6VII0_9FLAO|nr:4-hydroxythreonine-4-phosphate dehydrogenase PdxA [Luteibaculum oceani]TXC85183.1 4-hydroxythreonine-4-phosphate dehydrogenase PdxA [Luteibaculum oceani]